MYDRILIAVDGSDEAERAAERGLEFARAFDAAVDAVYVVDSKALRVSSPGSETVRLRERGEAVLEKIEALASDLDQSVTTELVEGKPADRIMARAADQDAGLIVVGRRGHTGLGKRLLGGVTERLLHRSDVPVFVVPRGASDAVADYSDLLVPTDGSEPAAIAGRHGAAVAREYGSTIHVLNVVDLQAAGGAFAAGGLGTEFIERHEAEGEEIVEDAAAEIEDAAPAVTTAVVRTTSFDGVAAGVREYVDEADIDLLVVGARSRSRLGRRILGSVTSTLLRTVDVPVLVAMRSS
ncbi:UspA domain protein (plasmid) [Haloterrigena turkmenica DSM 5511]|uniref:UspA domain protein n=1 Tax=Haloterrigena turkmenica (strain ATCC 51198 / DSM 5511 / JCM 9101 / NCIMB 13204 / VKM B-1734 / 4k) TaxID=543526 RepID=D2S1B7_HALTV|nr:universal stress protein [Haloterrigena turkmenica]ADB63164.1 UspA domain protein [Haloterrigena turkmenica DSM 5511]